MAWSDNWEKAKPAQNPRPLTRRVVVTVSAVVIAAAVCVGLFFAFSGGKEEPKSAKVMEKPKPAKVAKKPQPAKAKPKPKTPPAAEQPPAFVAPPPKPTAEERIDLVCSTNHHGEVLERWRTADGKTHARLTPPPRVFDNVIDQALSIVLSVPSGQMLPPMPSLGANAGNEFAAALKKPIEIKDTDSEQVKRAKLLVQAGREALLEAVSHGKTVNEALAEHCATINDNVALQREAGREYLRLIEEGDADIAERYREQANKILEQSGAAPVPKHAPRVRQPKGTNP